MTSKQSYISTDLYCLHNSDVMEIIRKSGGGVVDGRDPDAFGSGYSVVYSPNTRSTDEILSKLKELGASAHFVEWEYPQLVKSPTDALQISGSHAIWRGDD